MCFLYITNFSQKAITSGSNLIEVPLLSNTDVHSILDGWLSVRKRCLTDQQKQLVFKAFEKCPTPLFLKVNCFYREVNDNLLIVLKIVSSCSFLVRRYNLYMAMVIFLKKKKHAFEVEM